MSYELENHSLSISDHFVTNLCNFKCEIVIKSHRFFTIHNMKVIKWNLLIAICNSFIQIIVG